MTFSASQKRTACLVAVLVRVAQAMKFPLTYGTLVSGEVTSTVLQSFLDSFMVIAGFYISSLSFSLSALVILVGAFLVDPPVFPPTPTPLEESSLPLLSSLPLPLLEEASLPEASFVPAPELSFVPALRFLLRILLPPLLWSLPPSFWSLPSSFPPSFWSLPSSFFEGNLAVALSKAPVKPLAHLSAAFLASLLNSFPYNWTK
jgi:hypothetical protein